MEEDKRVNLNVAKTLQELATTPLVPGTRPNQESIHQMFNDINEAATSNPPDENDTKESEDE